ncbi:MAG: ABC transporter permease, partial [Prevotella sp.]|nr:ABC transporter permease [Prevotella sp.]
EYDNEICISSYIATIIMNVGYETQQEVTHSPSDDNDDSKYDDAVPASIYRSANLSLEDVISNYETANITASDGETQDEDTADSGSTDNGETDVGETDGGETEDGTYTTIETVIVKPQTMEEIIGLQFYITYLNDYYTICGIFDPGSTPSEYETMMKSALSGHGRSTFYSGSDKTVYTNFCNFVDDGMFKNAFLTENAVKTYCIKQKSSGSDTGDRFDRLKEPYYLCADGYIFSYSSDSSTDSSSDSSSDSSAGISSSDTWYAATEYYRMWNDEAFPFIYADGRTSGEFGDSEAILPLKMIRAIVTGETYTNSLTTAGSSDDNYSAYTEEEREFLLSADCLIQGYTYDEDGDYHYNTDEEIAQYESAVSDFINNSPITFSLIAADGDSYKEVQTFTLAGFYYGYSASDMGIYCSEAAYSKLPIWTHTSVKDPYDCPEDAVYSCAVFPVQHNESWLRSFFSKMEKADRTTTVYYISTNSLYTAVSNVDNIITLLSPVILVVGIIFAVFAALLLYNFISLSIVNKKREIGILRALGAKGTDVFKIFFSESGIISVICLVLGIVLTAVVSVFINSYLSSAYALMVNMVIFGGWSVLMLFAIAVVVAFFGTFIPVRRASLLSPVYCIRSL